MQGVFCCNTQLTDINASKEHILLNAAGGHLFSKNYYVKRVIVNMVMILILN